MSAKLTGFQHNGVSPFGMTSPIPVRHLIATRCWMRAASTNSSCGLCLGAQVIVAGDAAALPFIWLGGGAETVKLRIGVQQLVQALGAKVASGLTTLRTDL